jgi:hypothetical protein
MKYLLAALAASFIIMSHVPAANAATCVGGVHNTACVAGAYGAVVVRRGAAVVRAPVARRAVVIRR